MGFGVGYYEPYGGLGLATVSGRLGGDRGPLVLAARARDVAVNQDHRQNGARPLRRKLSWKQRPGMAGDLFVFLRGENAAPSSAMRNR